ncbi:MAG: CBS domain-containing protein [Deltaproteobacteria bacterium]|nr:MAG: CBS domain-containing protein [Deltaproteobacteria bacterium]
MLVKNWMRENVVTINVNDSVPDAVALIKKHQIRMLPVMDEDKLIGVVTDRDLKQVSASDVIPLEIHELAYKLTQIRIGEVMSKPPITVPFDYTVEEAAEVLLKHKISGVPVVDHEGQLVGTITQSDLFSVLMSVTGMGKRGLQYAMMQKRGIQFAFIVEDRPGSIRELEEIIRKYKGRMTSILSSYDRVSDGYRKVYIRMFSIDRSKLPQLKKELEGKARLVYMVDHRENKREIYQEGS